MKGCEGPRCREAVVVLQISTCFAFKSEPEGPSEGGCREGAEPIVPQPTGLLGWPSGLALPETGWWQASGMWFSRKSPLSAF